MNFKNDFDAQSDYGEIFCHKKKLLLSYILNLSML